MLNGLDPIIIFSFFKKLPAVTSAPAPKGLIPVVAQTVDRFALPPIPIYLSETLTGLYIDTEDKNIDIDTSVETLINGDSPLFNQKAIGTVVTVKMTAVKDSLGLTLISSMADLIIPKLTSQEYAITYLHGATTIFNGLLHGFAISQSADSEKIEITIEISLGGFKKQTSVDVQPAPGTAHLTDGKITGGTLPSGSSFTAPSGGVSMGPLR